jgi:hypothetical protein
MLKIKYSCNFKVLLINLIRKLTMSFIMREKVLSSCTWDLSSYPTLERHLTHSGSKQLTLTLKREREIIIWHLDLFYSKNIQIIIYNTNILYLFL